MKIFVPKEHRDRETRVPLVPAGVQKLTKLGLAVAVESGIGHAIHVDDDAYRDAGADIASDPDSAFADADIVLRLNPPPEEHIRRMKKGALHISYLDPFNRGDLLEACRDQGIAAISMEMIPRSTIAQKMDALSSQANLAGYEAVVLAAARLRKAFPMMMTPAGTIVPARVFVIGAGVAGLQAIATARRLGARVEAFDTRPVVKEQVESLGARFVEVDLGETGQDKDGYAKALTPEQLARQRDAMAKCCAQADVVITTAQIFGKRAPLIVTEEMVAGMKPGSVVVDLAVETGGNVAGSRLGEEVDAGGVYIIGLGNLPGLVPVDASLMYSNNITNFIEHFWDAESSTLKLDPDDDIVAGAMLTQDGQIRHPAFRQAGKENEQHN
jgi:NAD(P) transhydrogenase subunit alpha